MICKNDDKMTLGLVFVIYIIVIFISSYIILFIIMNDNFIDEENEGNI